MKGKPALWFLCALVLLAAALLGTSCGGGTTTTAETTGGETEAQTAAETLSPLDQTVAGLPEKDYGGYEFTIMDRSTDHIPWETYDVYTESENGDAINDAVYHRNRVLEELYNIEIVESPMHYPADNMQKLIIAGEDTIDLFMDGLNALTKMTTGNMLYDYNEISEIQLDQPWWDQQMRTELSVNGKSFFATGDISVMDNEATWCILFNKKMLSDYDLDDPYELVRSGKWTIDKMYEMAKAVAKDLDGDGKMTGADQFGFLTESYNVYALWVGGENMIIEKDGDDLPISSMYSERSASVYDKVLEFQFDANVTASAGSTVFPAYSDMNVCFTEGRGLFDYGAMALVSDFRESETDFGILPSPKYNEAQENYRNTFSPYNLMAYAIPVTASDISRTGTIMEAMAQVSQHILTPAYMEVSLKGKFIRDEESEEMIELLLATRSYDLGAIFQWGTSFNIFNSANSKKIGTFASQVEKSKKSLDNAIQKYIDQLESAE